MDAPNCGSGPIERLYRRALVDGGFLAAAGYGKGFPLVRGWGLWTLRRMADLFVETIAEPGLLDTTEPPIVQTADAYDAEVADIGGFADLYRLHLDGRAVVLRPDAAVFNIRHLVARRWSGGPSQVVARFQGFRSVRGATPALFRDRFIHPFVQYNRLVAADEAAQAEEAVTARLVAFFDAICLPVRIVDMGPWKRYARRLYIAVVHLPDGRPTVAAMFYIVGDSYRRRCAVPNDVAVFDIGITEKVLALVALRHADEVGIRLPSALAPVQMVATETAADEMEGQLPPGLRLSVVPILDDRSMRSWKRRGVPVQLHDGTRGPRLMRRSAGWSDVCSGEQVVAALIAEDERLWEETLATDLARAKPAFAPEAGSARTDGPPAPPTVVGASARLADRLGRPVAAVFPMQEGTFY